MAILSFILNLPWTIIGLIMVLISVPRRLQLSTKPFALIFYVRTFGWYSWLPGMKGVRAMTQGYIVLLGPTAEPLDLPHELIHVKQFQREPFIHPFLSQLQTMKYGYRQNKYEDEAYTKSGSRYAGKSRP